MLSTGAWTTAANRIQVGATSSDPCNVVFDDVMLDSGSMPVVPPTGPAAPVAAFSASPTTGTAPLNVVFSDASTGAPTAWLWTFGDGTTSALQNPSHSYAAGTYTVSLKATNAGGSNTLTKTAYVTVNPPQSGGSLVLAPPAPGTAGVLNTLTVTGCTPGANVNFVSGQVLGSSLFAAAACGAGVPIGLGSPYRIHGPVKANAAGVATFQFVPPATNAGKVFYFQAIEPGVCKASNVANDRL